jgi:hypothetical protein
VTGFPSASVLGWQSSRLPTDYMSMTEVARRACGALDPVRGMRVSSLRVCLAVPVMSRVIGSTLVRKPQCAGLVP